MIGENNERAGSRRYRVVRVARDALVGRHPHRADSGVGGCVARDHRLFVGLLCGIGDDQFPERVRLVRDACDQREEIPLECSVVDTDDDTEREELRVEGSGRRGHRRAEHVGLDVLDPILIVRMTGRQRARNGNTHGPGQPARGRASGAALG